MAHTSKAGSHDEQSRFAIADRTLKLKWYTSSLVQLNNYFKHAAVNTSTVVIVVRSKFKFACSNPAEAVGFFRAKKSSARLPQEGK